MPSVWIGINFHESDFVLIRLGNEDENHKLVWVAKTLLEPNFITGSKHLCQICIQYYAMASKNKEMYLGWDTKKTLKWKMDTKFNPCKIDTNSILTPWKP